MPREPSAGVPRVPRVPGVAGLPALVPLPRASGLFEPGTGTLTPDEFDLQGDTTDAENNVEAAQTRLHKANAVYGRRPPRASRFSLRLTAAWWRALQWIGMTVHHFLAWPRPPKPSFDITVPTTLASRKGHIKLHFYVPDQYHYHGGRQPAGGRPLPYTASSAPHMTPHHAPAHANTPAGGRSGRNPPPHATPRPGHAARSRSANTHDALTHALPRHEPPRRRWPAVVNFHGGGFALGSGTDDARFARVVLAECDAVFVSVDYRLAPEHPFPTAVEDGADALMYLIRHADALRIDPMRMATSGFSAGGNLALTAPLMLAELLNLRDDIPPVPSHPLVSLARVPSLASPAGPDAADLGAGANGGYDPNFLSPVSPPKPFNQSSARPGTLHRSATSTTMASTYSTVIPTALPSLPPHRILAAATWYPITDYTISRADRRAASIRPEATLSRSLCNLFDSSYLYPATIDLALACLSPSRATDAQLRRGIPPTVLFYTCEWDMLMREGEALARRLASPAIGKRVVYHMIEGVRHAWDKMPTLLRPPARAEALYVECCATLREAFEEAAAQDEGVEIRIVR